MSGRKVRQWRERQKRLATLAECDCGPRICEEDGEVYFYPHSPNCAFLLSIPAQPNWCIRCGRLLDVRRRKDYFGTVYEWSGCPAGHEGRYSVTYADFQA